MGKKLLGKKLLGMRDYLSLALGGAGDLFEDLADAGGLMSFSYKQVYGFVPRRYKKSYFLKTISQTLTTGEIEKIIKNGKPYLRLTSRGKKKFQRDFPILSLRKRKWDGRWRIIIFDVPENKRGIRKVLRQKLLELGFGMIQWSVYISPYDFAQDLKEFLEAFSLGRFAFVLEAKTLLIEDQKALVAKVWKLNQLNREYERLFKALKKMDQKISGQEKRRLRGWYFDILAADPLLPAEFLPSDWLGEEVRKAISRLG